MALVAYGFILLTVSCLYLRGLFDPHEMLGAYGSAALRLGPFAFIVLAAWTVLDLLYCRCPACGRYIGVLDMLPSSWSGRRPGKIGREARGLFCESERRVFAKHPAIQP